MDTTERQEIQQMAAQVRVTPKNLWSFHPYFGPLVKREEQAVAAVQSAFDALASGDFEELPDEED